MQKSHLKNLKRKVDQEFNEISEKKKRVDLDLEKFTEIKKQLDELFVKNEQALKSEEKDVVITSVPYEKDCDRYACSCTSGYYTGFLGALFSHKSENLNLVTEISDYLDTIAQIKYNRLCKKIYKDDPKGEKYSRFGILHQYDIVFTLEKNDKLAESV